MAATDATFSVNLGVPEPEQIIKQVQDILDSAMKGANASVASGGEEMQATLAHHADEAGKQAENKFKEHFDKIKEHAKESFGEIGSLAAGVALGGGVMAGMQGIGSAFEKLFEKGKEFAELKEKSTIAFQSIGMSAKQAEESTEALVGQSSVLADKFAVDRNAIIQATQAYLSFGGSTDNLSGKQEIIIGLAQRLQAKGMDMASAMNRAAIMIAKAGSPEATMGLQMLGVQIPTTATQAERLAIMSKAAAGGIEGLTTAANSPLGNMKKLQNSFNDIMSNIGGALVEGIGTAVGYISDVFTKFWKVAQPILKDIWDVISHVFVEIWKNDIVPMWDSIKNSFSNLFSGIASAFGMGGKGGASFGDIMKTVGTVVKDVISYAMIPLQIAIKVGTAIVKTYYAIWTEVYKIIATVIGDAVRPLIDWFSKLFGKTDEGVQKVGFFKQIWDKVVFGFEHFQSVIAGSMKMLDAFFDQIQKAGAGVGEFLEGITSLDPAKIKEGFGKVTDAMSNMGSAMKSGFMAGFAENEVMDAAKKTSDKIQGGFSGEAGEKNQKKEKTGKDKTFDDDMNALKEQHKAQETELLLSLTQQGVKKQEIEKKLLEQKIAQDAVEIKLRQQHLDKIAEMEKTATGAKLAALKEQATKERMQLDELKLNAIQSEQKITEMSEQEWQKQVKANEDAWKKKQEAFKKAEEASIAHYQKQRELDKEYNDTFKTDVEKQVADENTRYQKELDDVNKFHLDKEQAERIHQQKLHDIRLAAILQQNQIVAMSATVTKNLEGQTFNWLDERVKASTHNQKTVWFALQSEMIKATENFVAQYIEQAAKRFVAERILGTTAQAETIAANAATSAAIGATAAGPASLVATMTFGGAAMAGMSAMLTSAATAHAIGAAAEGGVIVGERGPEFIASPAHMVDYTAHMSQAVASATERALMRRQSLDVNVNNNHQYSMKRSISGLDINSTVEANSHKISKIYQT